MTASLTGKVAVVTGGTQGLGAAIATLFAQRGAEGIVVCGRNADKGSAKAEAIRSETGCRVKFVQADLSQVADCSKVVDAADRAFGRIDVLVNAAGNTDRGTILDTTPETFDTLFAVNTRAPFFLIQGAVKVMRRESTHGAVVNISSMSAMGGARHVDAQRRLRPAAQQDTRERPEHRLDGVGRRGPHPARVPRRRPDLA